MTKKFKELLNGALFTMGESSRYAYRKTSSKSAHKEHDQHWTFAFDPEIEIFEIEEDWTHKH